MSPDLDTATSPHPATVTTIHLVRHAQSWMNLTPGLVGGRSNHTPLSAAGELAARERGRELAAGGIAPAALYCTSAVRSRATAELLAEGAGWDLPPVLEDGLIELSQGAAEGHPREGWWTPQAVEAMRADPLNHRLAPDGESHAEVQHRMVEALHRIAGRHPGQVVVAVSHGIAMRTLVWRLTGGSHDRFRSLELPNLALLTLEVDDRTIRLQVA